jgi:hypothetical protein
MNVLIALLTMSGDHVEKPGQLANPILILALDYDALQSILIIGMVRGIMKRIRLQRTFESEMVRLATITRILFQRVQNV